MKQRKSYVSGAATLPLSGETIGEALRNAAQKWPGNLALVSRHEEIRWTYRMLDELTDQLAAGLLAAGFRPGERLGIWAPNCARWTLVQYAAARAGLILVTINPAYRASELIYALRKVGCAGLMTASRFKTMDYLGILREVVPEIDRPYDARLQAAQLPELRKVITLEPEGPAGTVSFDAILQMTEEMHREELQRIEAALEFDDAVLIQFTSGTTGAPKGATLTHHGILNNSLFIGEGMGMGAEDRVCVPVPLYHTFGMVGGNLAALQRGACVVYPSPAFDVDAVLSAIAEERCTILYGVPTMFVGLLQSKRRAELDLSSLGVGVIAGASCPEELLRRIVDDLGIADLSPAYGMTETSPLSFQARLDDTLEAKARTVGNVMPHVEVKLVDSQGRMVPWGQAGEILVRGYGVMKGYWEDPERTAETIDSDGWLHTGDLGQLDEGGRLSIVGRVKDMIIRGGENIYPAEIESVLFAHPDIAEAQVIGLPDDFYGEKVCAVVRRASGSVVTAEEIIDFCQPRMAHFKVPAVVEFVDAFPMTVTGKIQKHLLRERFAPAHKE